MRKKLWAIIAMVAVMICSTVMGLTAAFAPDGAAKTVDDSGELKFTGVYMGGYDWTAGSQVVPPTTTNWGNGVGLAFVTNAYDLDASGNQKTIQDQVTEVSDGAEGFKTNKQLVEYIAKDGSTDRHVEVIWWDTQGDLVFRLDNYNDANALGEDTGVGTLKYYKYGDGDRVTVKQGFTFPYNDGATAKKLVLKSDVTVEFDADKNNWFEVVNGEKKIVTATANDVTVMAGAPNGYGWGFMVSLFKDKTRPLPFAELTTDNNAGGMKQSARTDSGWGSRMFNIEKQFVSYLQPNGTELALDEIYLTSMGITLRPGQLTSPEEGAKLILRKGFRDVYYYGAINEWMGQKFANTHFGAWQTLATLEEDVVFVCKDGAWVKANTASSNIDFAANIKSLNKIYKDQTIALAYNENAEEVPEYSSSAPERVAVSATGTLTGGTEEGEAVITVKFITKTLTLTLNNVLTPVITGISAKVDADYGAVILYKDYANSSMEVLAQVTVSSTYDNGFAGATLDNSDVTVDFTGYDNTKVYNGSQDNAQTVKLKSDAAETTVPVHVYVINKTGAPAPTSVDFWGQPPAVIFSAIPADQEAGVQHISASILEKFGQTEKVIMKLAKLGGDVTYRLTQISYIYAFETALNFENKAKDTMAVGDTLTLKEGFRIYKRINGALLAVHELDSDVTYVWTGSAWGAYTAEATGLELDKEQVTLPLGAAYSVGYTILPSGAYMKATVISSNPEAVAVSSDGTSIEAIAPSAEPVTVKVQLGDHEDTAKTLTVNVTEAEVNGYEIYQPQEYVVSLNGEFKLEYYYNAETTPRKIQAVEVYEDGSRGVPFELNDTNCKFDKVDTSVAGNKTVTLTIDKDGDGSASKPFTTNVTVVVRPSVAQVSAGIMQNPFGDAPNKLYINFNQTFLGKVNVPATILAEYQVASYIKFVRGETEMNVSADINGEFLVLAPVYPSEMADADKQYKTGDKYVISEGMPMILWTGKDNNYSMVGAGNYVIAGTIEYEVVYDCTNPKEKTWDTFIQYEGIEVESENIEIGFGKLKDIGATMIPAYATVGEFELTSADDSIVSVNANGLIKGEKIGTTKVTITLDGGANGPITKEVTVTVVDVRSDLKFSLDRIYVKTGTPLTAQLLSEKVKAQFVWASGKVEGNVDLSKATVIGFTASKEGDQVVTVRVMVDGTTVTGKLNVTVNKKGKKAGCGAAVFGATGAIAALSVVLAAGVVLNKKRG